MIPAAATAGTAPTQAERRHDAARHGRRRHDAHDPPPDVVRQPAAEDLAEDVGERLQPEGGRRPAGPEPDLHRARDEGLEDALVEDPDGRGSREQDPEPAGPHDAPDAAWRARRCRRAGSRGRPRPRPAPTSRGGPTPCGPGRPPCSRTSSWPALMGSPRAIDGRVGRAREVGARRVPITCTGGAASARRRGQRSAAARSRAPAPRSPGRSS